MSRLGYWKRIAASYLFSRRSQLTFWHETPELNPNLKTDALDEYYMVFAGKADYPGPFDAAGIPQLDYHGAIGVQYNPIAIAQYGLANYNQLIRTREEGRRQKLLQVADWLVANLERNGSGLRVWNHHFDFEYRTPLKAPWYSGLAQGQGISLLVRAHAVSGERRYLDAAGDAFESMRTKVDQGGVLVTDGDGRTWIEEYIVDPPTHILNGFIWALWGVYDYHLSTGKIEAKKLFDDCIATILQSLERYDAGFWSLYELSGTWMRMLASPYYHRLHIAQLRVMFRLTGQPKFQEVADRWESFTRSWGKRCRARIQKAVFKLCYY